VADRCRSSHPARSRLGGYQIDLPCGVPLSALKNKKRPPAAQAGGPYVNPQGFCRTPVGFAAPQRIPASGLSDPANSGDVSAQPVNLLRTRDILRAPRQRSPAITVALPLGIALNPPAMIRPRFRGCRRVRTPVRQPPSPSGFKALVPRLWVHGEFHDY
jgi:hypothetical protein